MVRGQKVVALICMLPRTQNTDFSNSEDKTWRKVSLQYLFECRVSSEFGIVCLISPKTAHFVENKIYGKTVEAREEVERKKRNVWYIAQLSKMTIWKPRYYTCTHKVICVDRWIRCCGWFPSTKSHSCEQTKTGWLWGYVMFCRRWKWELKNTRTALLEK